MKGGGKLKSHQYYGPRSIGSYGEETAGHRFWRQFRKFSIWAIGLGVILGGSIMGLAMWMAPKTSSVSVFNRPPTVEFLDSSNKPFYESDQKRFLALNSNQEVSSNFKNALLSVEDRNFYHESGVNYLRTVKAVGHDLWRPFSRQESIEGGSTIT